MGVPFITEAVYVNLTHFGSVTAFYEKVKNVKADVAAVLVMHRTLPAEVLNSVKGVRQDVHLDP